MVLPAVNQSVRIDGRQYGLSTGLGGGCITYVKQAWLDAVGMKAEDITDWDSYYAMLKAFTEQDPDGNGKNDTYGVAAAGFIGSEAPYTNYLPQFWQNAYPSVALRTKRQIFSYKIQKPLLKRNLKKDA